jgi:Rod binding domain-containing protein
MISDVTSITSSGSKATPKEVAAKVQGMFTEVMLKSMEDSVDAEDGLFGNSASADIYRGMLRQQIAATMTKEMKSPLEGQLDKALNKQSGPNATHDDDSGSHLPVSGVINELQDRTFTLK